MRSSLCQWLQRCSRISSDVQQIRYRKRRHLPCLASNGIIQIRYSQATRTSSISKAGPITHYSDPTSLQSAIDIEIQKVRALADSLRNDPTGITFKGGYTPENPGSLSWRVALSIIDECISQNVPISTSFSARVMSLLTRSGRIEHAEALFEAIIARRGGMRLDMNHVRPILKYYIKFRMQEDAKRIYDVTRAFLHDPNIVWLLFYMMKLYDSVGDIDSFEHAFRMSQDLPEERERQLCHMVLMDALIRRAPAQAVLHLYNQMKEAGMIPVGQIMVRVFRCLQMHRMGDVAWKIYVDDFHTNNRKRAYDFDIWREVTLNLIKSSVENFSRLLDFTPKDQLFNLLWIAEAPDFIDAVVQRVIEHEGFEGPSRKALTKALVRRLSEETDSDRIVALFETLPAGDHQLFPRYLEALIATNQREKVTRIFYDEPGKFLDPAAATVALKAFYELNDGLGAIAIARLTLYKHATGNGVDRPLLDSALLTISHLRPMEDLQSLWNCLRTYHAPLLRSHTYLVASTCFLRHDEHRLAFQLLAEALLLCDSHPLLRKNFYLSMRQFIAAGLLTPWHQLARHFETRPDRIYGDEAREILVQLRYIMIKYSVDVHIDRQGRPMLGAKQVYSRTA